MSRRDPAAPAPGTPRSPAVGERLERYDRAMQLPIFLAAVLPILLGLLEARDGVAASVYVATWLVFLGDFVVHERLTRRYAHSWRGRFDLAVVILTAPWFFVPGLAHSRLLVIMRLARLARIIVATRAARVLLERLSGAVAAAASLIFLCSYITYRAERDTNPEFGDYGDALWWGIVTITTVGYGDIVPRTTEGRWAAVVLMVAGVGLIGALAGSIATFFRLDRRGGTVQEAETRSPT